MDSSKYLAAARHIVSDDGAEGVAVIMADHERLLQALRMVYTLTAPAGEADIDTRMSEARATALAGLRLPEDLKQRLVASGKPASTEGAEFEIGGHEHEWREVGRHMPAGAVPEQTISLEYCGCGLFRIARGDDQPRVYIPEAEASLLCGITDEFAKDRINRAEKAVRDAEARSMSLEGQRDGAQAAADRLAAEVKQERAARVAVEERARVLVRHLAGEEPAWWVEAGRAIDSLDRLMNTAQATEGP